MYGSSLRVPLILALPGAVPAGRRTDDPASLVDVAPTILGLLGLPAPASFQGRNLLAGPTTAFPRPLFFETNGRIYGVRTNEWRLILNPDGRTPGAPGGPYPIEPVELYDLARDPNERHNVAAGFPERVEELSAKIDVWRRHTQRSEQPLQEIDPDTLEELRALGYVVE
jgi:arylsulfatase A-like enzyme